MPKVYGGWAAFGEPEFDGSSVSGGAPVHNNTPAQNARASKKQKGFNAADNCRQCKPDKGRFCAKHAKKALGG